MRGVCDEYCHFSRNPQRRTLSQNLNIESTLRVAKMSLVSAVPVSERLALRFPLLTCKAYRYLCKRHPASTPWNHASAGGSWSHCGLAHAAPMEPCRRVLVNPWAFQSSCDCLCAQHSLCKDGVDVGATSCSTWISSVLRHMRCSQNFHTLEAIE